MSQDNRTQDQVAKDKAHFNHLPPDQAEALALLAEECGELVQIIGKILRHGLDSHHPDTGDNNVELLQKEVGDVLAALRIAEVQRLIFWDWVVRCRDRKLMKVVQYLHHAKVSKDE